MTYELPKFTDEEILASTEAHAAHWENEARYSPADVAFHCRDYAQHLRTIAECLRMDILERDLLRAV
jgi:formiminotetrahydrofolate cyclodeaminase